MAYSDVFEDQDDKYDYHDYAFVVTGGHFISGQTEFTSWERDCAKSQPRSCHPACHNNDIDNGNGNGNYNEQPEVLPQPPLLLLLKPGFNVPPPEVLLAKPPKHHHMPGIGG